MLLFSSITLSIIFLCVQGGAVKDAKGKHTLLATKDKLYLAKLSESKMEKHWRQEDYQGNKPEDDELKNKTKATEQDDKSKENRDEKNESNKKKTAKKRVDKKKANKKKTPFEITGGNEALPHEFPWIAYLNVECQQHSGLQYTCGGSLISPRVVLSAYHCSCNHKRQGQHVDYRALNAFAYLGAHNVKQKTYTTKKIIDVKYPPNPVYNDGTGQGQPDRHDLALFVLNEPVKFSPKISPICLPSQDQDFSGKTATVAGWGHTLKGPKFLGKPGSPVLKKVQMTVGRVLFNMIEATSLAGPGQNACPGDSGGPLMYKNTTSNILIGTLSGTVGDYCGHTGRVHSNKVSDWVNWITKEMDQLGEKTDSKSCNNNGGQGFGNQDGGGGDDGLDNQDKNGGDSVDNQDQDGGDGLGNQDQFGDTWPFGPNQNPLFPF